MNFLQTRLAECYVAVTKHFPNAHNFPVVFGHREASVQNDHYEIPGKHISYWIDSSPETNFPILRESLQVDVAIIGGGITGLAFV